MNMLDRTDVTPIAIGGLGGSGTRVVAEILRRAGLYMGADLNEQNDNLWFTLLFKRPSCVRDIRVLKTASIDARLEVFSKCMQGVRPDIADRLLVFFSAIEMARKGHNYRGDGRGKWAFDCAFSMMSPPAVEKPSARWGWKEPNTHIYIPYLNKYFTEIQYVHVLRHGLDMAFSENQQQLMLWGPVFDIKKPEPADIPRAALKYWIRSTRHAVMTGKVMGPERFLLLNFDELCDDPGTGITKLLSFAGLEPPPEDLRTLVKKPDTAGRYRGSDLSAFHKSELDAVREYGFEIEE